MLSNNKWTRKNFEFLLKKYNLKKHIEQLTKLKNKKIALIGTSPITLIVANIYSLYDANLTIFEKGQFGGAWQSKLIKKNNYPCSTHILMPGILTYDILKMMGVPNKVWSIKPYSIEFNKMKYDLFPKKKSDYDKFLMNDFSFGSMTLSQHLYKKIKKENIRFLNKNINQIEECSNEVKLFSKRNNYIFDYVFLTPAADIKSIKFQKKIIKPKYNIYLNQSYLFLLSNKFKLGSTFIHFFGNSPIREVQTFSDKIKNKAMVVKLSAKNKISHVSQIISLLKKIYNISNLLDNSKTIKINYHMKRMTPNTQKKIMNASKKIVFPFQISKNLGDKKLVSLSQDISRLIGHKRFINSIIKKIKN